MKKLFIVLTVLTFAVFCACGSKKNSDAVSDGAKKIKVGLVSSSSGFGDGAFNDLTLQGFEKAKEDFGIEYDKVQIKAVGDIELSIRDMAATNEYDLIMALTYEAIQAMDKVAPDYPDQKFAIIDTQVDQPNVASYMTKDEEGSFLTGIAAAGLKKHYEEFGLKNSNKIGFIGGVDAPNIRIFYTGYTAGAKYVNKDIEAIPDFVGSFTDVTTAKEIANSMYQHEIDAVFHAAGMSGNGLFQAAKENKSIAFGVNLNQNSVEPDCIAGSMIKKVDVEAYNAIKAVVENNFKPEMVKLGLKEDGIGFAVDGSNIKLPEDVLNLIEEAEKKISDGDITVPTNEEELNAFISNLK